ncbi:MAG: hypothetical protein AAB368_09080, partial [bacterium]
MSVTALILSALLSVTAGASELRFRALGAVPGIVEDEATDLTPANLGNPAGLAWLPRGTRLDYGVVRDESAQEHDSFIGKTERTDTSWRLGSPGGPYELFTRVGERNAWQVGLDGGADFTNTSLQPVGQKDTTSATTFFGVEARPVLWYARRMTERLALGGFYRPLGGGLGVPADDRVATRDISFSLGDYGLGAAMRFPGNERWGEGTAGISYTPFNDRLDLRAALGLAVGASDALTDVGAYQVTQTLTFKDGTTQSWKTTPEGTTLAGQGTWRKDGGRWEAAATLDGTSARAMQENSTGRILPGGTQLVQQGLASEFSRTRWTLSGRHRRDLAGGDSLRFAL